MFKQIFVFFTIFITFTHCHSAEDDFSRGLDEMSAGQFQFAVARFEKAIQKSPYFKDSYIQQSICYEHLNQHDSAISSLSTLLKFFPDNTAGNYYMGVCHYRLKKYAEAITWYDRALDAKGGFNVSDTNSFQAMLDLNKDNFESESAEYDIPIPEILYDRAMALYETGEVSKARNDFANCITLEYNTGNSYYMIGLCHLAKKHKRNAREAFTAAFRFGNPLAKQQLKLM